MPRYFRLERDDAVMAVRLEADSVSVGAIMNTLRADYRVTEIDEEQARRIIAGLDMLDGMNAEEAWADACEEVPVSPEWAFLKKP